MSVAGLGFLIVHMLVLSSPLAMVDVHAGKGAQIVESKAAVEARVKIEAALASPTALKVDKTPLTELPGWIAAHYGIPVQLDESDAFREAEIELVDTLLTTDTSGITLETGLRRMLAGLQLKFVIHDGVLLITTRERASGFYLELVIYRVEDLTEAGSPESLVQLLMAAAEPESWDEVGGQGSVLQVEHLGLLAIRQSRDVHRDVASLLAALRKVRSPVGSDAPLLSQRATAGALGAPVAERPVTRIYRRRPTDEGVQQVAAAELVELIVTVVEPGQWDVRGGKGTARAAGDCVAIRQSRRLFDDIERILADFEYDDVESGFGGLRGMRFMGSGFFNAAPERRQ